MSTQIHRNIIEKFYTHEYSPKRHKADIWACLRISTQSQPQTRLAAYHTPDTSDRPVVAQNEPTGQGVGALAAASGQYQPAGKHGVGAVEPAAQNVPAAHTFCVALDEPAVQKWPAWQRPDTAASCAAPQNAPAGHVMGSALPAGQ